MRVRVGLGGAECERCRSEGEGGFDLGGGGAGSSEDPAESDPESLERYHNIGIAKLISQYWHDQT